MHKGGSILYSSNKDNLFDYAVTENGVTVRKDVSDVAVENLKKEGKISVPFEFLGHKYAYYTEDLISSENSVTELHYSTIDDFKKVAKEVVAIYIKPNVEMAKKQLKLRCLPKTVEKFRLKEIKEQVELFENNINIQNKFDYIISNNYTEESVNNAVELIKNIEERRCVSEISG